MDDEDSINLMQAARCRRIASQMTDHDIRHALEDLAREYEARVRTGTGGFMLRSSMPEG
jgi:hypothetical protein